MVRVGHFIRLKWVKLVYFRIDRAQQSIEDMSHPTNRVLQECRDQVNVLKSILREVKKHDIPTVVEFELNTDMSKFFTNNKTLGETNLKTVTGKKTGSTIGKRKKRPNTTRDIERKANALVGVDGKYTEFKLRQVQSARELREEYLRDTMAASHDTKNLIVSTMRNKHKSSESLLDIVTNTFPKVENHSESDDDHYKYDLKSLRVDVNKHKSKQAVRYQSYDFVKEITAMTENDDEQYASSTKSSSIRHSPHGSTTTTSSMYVNPGQSMASGALVRSSQSDQQTGGTLKSYFTYKSRFHTKPHREQTDLCRLTGIAAMDDGKVLVSDVSHLQVMLFGKHFNFLYSIQCNSPYGICAMSSNMAAVTMYHGRKILLVKVHGIYIEKIRGINIDCAEHLYGVTYRADRLFVLCHEGDIHVIALHTKTDGAESLDRESRAIEEPKRLTRREQEKIYNSAFKDRQKWDIDDSLDASPLYCRDLDGHWKEVRVISTEIQSGTARHIDVLDDGSKMFVSGNGRVTCFDESGK